MTRSGFAAADFIGYSVFYLTASTVIVVLCNTIMVVLSCLVIVILTIYHWQLTKREAMNLIINPNEHLVKKTFSNSFIQIGKDIHTVPNSLWIIVIIGGLGYVPFSCFTVVASEILQISYGYDQGLCDNLLLLPCFCAIIGSPLTGIVLDKFGRLPVMMICASLLYILCHFYIFYGFDNRVLLFVLLATCGFAFAMFATSLWSAVACISNSSTIGINNGFAYMFYALFNAVCQFIVCALTQTDSVNICFKYYYVELFFIMISVIMLMFSILLMVYDKQSDKKLFF